MSETYSKNQQNKRIKREAMRGLFNDDCFNILEKIEDNCIDFILTDLPYGTTNCKWDVVLPFEKMWKHIERVTKENSCIALFGTEPFSSNLRLSNIDCYKYDWYWNKKRISNPLLAKKQPLRNIELISIFYKKQPTYNPQPTEKSTSVGLSLKRHNEKHLTETVDTKYKVDRNLSEIGYPKSLINHVRVINNLTHDKSGLHPTQKPIELCEYLIKTYTNKNDLVLDFTMGSGSTGVACKITNRNFIGIEKDKQYFEIAKDRIDYAFI
jgi:site-specific DNA-methyltransferase (adenine-specific)